LLLLFQLLLPVLHQCFLKNGVFRCKWPFSMGPISRFLHSFSSSKANWKTSSVQLITDPVWNVVKSSRNRSRPTLIALRLWLQVRVGLKIEVIFNVRVWVCVTLPQRFVRHFFFFAPNYIIVETWISAKAMLGQPRSPALTESLSIISCRSCQMMTAPRGEYFPPNFKFPAILKQHPYNFANRWHTRETRWKKWSCDTLK
jgi:hypothetical protein